MPNWNMKKWETGKRMTLLQAFGISSTKFKYPELKPELPGASAGSQHPIQVSSGGKGDKTSAHPSQKGPLKQYARKLLRDNGWGDQWDAFNSLEMSEAGWNPKIPNPNSGAYGLAQALGHGDGSSTQGTYSNNYGGFGLSAKQAKAANSGDGYAQLDWMMAYIKQQYGSPDNAWSFHIANNWY